MKTLHIIKTGTTFPDTLREFGDFDSWTAESLGDIDIPISIVDIEHGAPLPEIDSCAGVIITGSHAMVTDDLPWSLALEEWVKELLTEEIPIFGICYGHQLLGRAAGGQVGFHPQGKEVGTVSVEKQPASASDPLFADQPATFNVHATHAQSVLSLPEQAALLASNDYEPHHAFRVGPVAWGVQFHPEYSPEIMQAYVEHQRDVLIEQGRDVPAILATIAETPIATNVYRKFGQLVVDRQATLSTSGLS